MRGSTPPSTLPRARGRLPRSRPAQETAPVPRPPRTPARPGAASDAPRSGCKRSSTSAESTWPHSSPSRCTRFTPRAECGNHPGAGNRRTRAHVLRDLTPQDVPALPKILLGRNVSERRFLPGCRDPNRPEPLVWDPAHRDPDNGGVFVIAASGDVPPSDAGQGRNADMAARR